MPNGTLPPGPYPWIRAWGWMMGSGAYYITDQIERARATHAPADAIYEITDANGKTGRWERARDIENPNTRFVLENEFGALPAKEV